MTTTPPPGPSHSERQRFRQLIEDSTLGSEGGRALRERTSDTEVDQLLARADNQRTPPPDDPPSSRDRLHHKKKQSPARKSKGDQIRDRYAVGGAHIGGVVANGGSVVVRNNVISRARRQVWRGVVVLAVLVPLMVLGVRVLFFSDSTQAPPVTIDAQLLRADDPGGTPYLSAPPPGSAPPSEPITPLATLPGGTRRYSGGTDGLYSGIRDQMMGGREQIIDFYRSDRVAAAAAAAALETDATLTWSGGHLTATNLVDYLNELTAVWLRADTRVTDYATNWGDGGTANQVVLQMGTAVLIDRTGVPRIRSISGSPLTAPEQVATRIHYTGTAWQEFSPATVVTITPSAPLQAFTLLDLRGGLLFSRPSGTVGVQDQDAPTTTTPPATTTTPPPVPIPGRTLADVDTSGDWLLESESSGVSGTLTRTGPTSFQFRTDTTSEHMGWDCELRAQGIDAATMRCLSLTGPSSVEWSSTGRVTILHDNEGRVRLYYTGKVEPGMGVTTMILRYP